MVETLSRLNGAVHVGNTDLILPVRVRARAENVGRTSGCPGGTKPVRINQWAYRRGQPTLFRRVARWPGSSCELLPLGRSIATSPELVVLERFHTVNPLRPPRCLALSFGNNGVSSRPVKSQPFRSASTGNRINATYKAKPKGSLMR